MKKGAKKLLGRKDFSVFRSSSCNAKSPIRTMKSIKIKEVKNKIQIQFKSQSFLQQQVRSMVGCLKYLAEKKWNLVEEILVSPTLPTAILPSLQKNKSCLLLLSFFQQMLDIQLFLLEVYSSKNLIMGYLI